MKTDKIKATTPEEEEQFESTAGRRGVDDNEPAINLVPALLKIHSILVPLDFSEESLKALRYAARFADQFGARITLLHVVEPIAMPDFTSAFPLAGNEEEMTQEGNEKLAALIEKEGIEPRFVEKTLVRQGRSFHEITTAARTLKADLIIIATHGRTGLKHALLGSTAERVVRHAPCPVLVLREQEKEFI